MYAKRDAKLSLKVTVNKQKRKVLFAEVDGSFADLLFSFLTLPLATIVRILKKHYGEVPAFGSLSSLYNSLANLDTLHFRTEGAKSILLHPRSSSDAECKRLKLDISDSPPLEEFVCPNNGSSRRFDGFHVPDACICIDCSYNKAKSITKRLIPKRDTQTVASDGVFTISAASFLITDDLQIVSNTGLMQIVRVLGITFTDMDKAETMNITFGKAEVMDLLKASLISSTPLSDVILNKRGEMMNSRKRKYELQMMSSLNAPTDYPNSKKVNLKVIVQKSTNKLLYGEAEEEFIEFLFSLLAIPLGRVECLLSSNASIKSIDNLYRSIADLNENKYFKNPDAKNRVIKPMIPHGYISKNHILPLTEERLPTLYNETFWYPSGEFPRDRENYLSGPPFPRGHENYLSGPRTYQVMDDLTVAPFSIVSILSCLNKLKIPTSDVKEVQLQIGFKEGLSILKASLTSTSALTDALLINQKSYKQPKTEV